MNIEDIRAAIGQDYKPTQKMVRTLLKEIDRLTALCDGYKEALEKYGEHSSGCAGDRFGAKCTCGFEAALQKEEE